MKQTKFFIGILCVGLFSGCLGSAFTINGSQMRQIRTVTVVPIVQDPKLQREVTSSSESSHSMNAGRVSAIGINSDMLYSLSISGPSARSDYKSSITTKGDFIDDDTVARNAIAMDFSDALSSALMDNDYKIIERSRLTSVFQEKRPKLSGSAEEDSLRLASLAGVDAVMFVEVTRLAQKRIFSEDLSTGEKVPKTQYELKYKIRMISSKDGLIVATARSPASGNSDFSDSLEEYAQMQARGLAWDLGRTLKELKGQ